MSSSENNQSEKSQLRNLSQYTSGQNYEQMRFVKRILVAILIVLVIIALAVILTGFGVFQLLQNQTLSETESPTNPTTTLTVRYSTQTKPPVTVSYIGTPVFAFQHHEALISYMNGQKKMFWPFDGAVSTDSKCSFLFEDKIYLLGSSSGDRAYKRQIARVENCKLKRVGSITWKSKYGYYLYVSQTTCTTVAQQIVICSSSSQSLECYKATNPFANFTYFGESNFFHPRSFISSSESDIFVIGGREYGTHKSELMSVKTWKWRQKASYPYSRGILDAPTLFSGKSFYVFGGYNSPYGTMSTIAAFTPGNGWKKLGNMKSQRYDASVIEVDGYFLIIGGSDTISDSSEICKLVDGDMHCEYQENSVTTEGMDFFMISPS